jgi:hypothetical protein
VIGVIEFRTCNRVTGTSIKRLELLLVMHEHIGVLTKHRSLLVYLISRPNTVIVKLESPAQSIVAVWCQHERFVSSILVLHR